MKIWSLLFILLPVLGCVYVFRHIWKMIPFVPWVKVVVLVLMTAWFASMFVYFATRLEPFPMGVSVFLYKASTSFIFVLLYLFLIFLVLDLGKIIGVLPKNFLVNSAEGTLTVIIAITLVLVGGRVKYEHKSRREINIETEKPLEKPLKIVLMSDLHLGYNIRGKELSKWAEKINTENPDFIIIGGDVLDGNIRPVTADRSFEVFRSLHAPVFGVFGNHEYYTGPSESEDFYAKAGIRLLNDTASVVSGINVVGRDDRTNVMRKSVDSLMNGIDTSLFTILLDHQPYGLEEASSHGVDFQFSGHTHYGQMWPISWIERLIFEDAYGYYSKGKTSYYVSSGIGIWGPKMRIGTRSEYVVLNIRPKDVTAAS